MMTFENRLAMAVAYAERQGIRITPQRREQIAAKIREKMDQTEKQDAVIEHSNKGSEGGVKPYEYGSLTLSRIEERVPVKDGDLRINIQHTSTACIVQMADSSGSHIFTLPPFKTVIGL